MSSPIDTILNELINQVEWSVQVPGAPYVNRAKEDIARRVAKRKLRELMAEDRELANDMRVVNRALNQGKIRIEVLDEKIIADYQRIYMRGKK